MKKSKGAGTISQTVIWQGKRYELNALAANWARKLEAAFGEYQSTRRRDAVYDYLAKVYLFAMRFERARDCKLVSGLMLSSKGMALRGTSNCFSSIVRATAEVNEKARWKWVQCLSLAETEEIEPKDLREFILYHHGGINKCADASLSAVEK